MNPQYVILRTLLVFGWSMSATIALADEGSSRPNILFFIGDNWSWPHAGILGDPTVKTPVFDRVAKEGVLFNHAFCPVPSCSPTRSCILTGRAAHQLEDAASLWSAFPRKFKVFTDALRESGYEVGYSGKGWSPGRYIEYGWPENPVGKQFKNFAGFMEQRDTTKPFFFWNGNTDTALYNWRYEPEGWEGLDPKSLKVPPELPDTEEVRLSMLAYYGAVGRIDLDAHRCVDELEQRKLLDDTVVVYTSDNGWQMPRGLANCYDSGTRVPMAIRWGKRLEAGRKTNDFISLTDLAPTFLELAGVTFPAEMTSHSFVDVLLDKPRSLQRDCFFVERERHANVRRGDLSYPIRGIRTKDFLYLWNIRPERWPAGDPKAYYAVGDYGDVDGSRAKLFLLENAARTDIVPFFELCFGKRPKEELFDLGKDPSQLTNVAGNPDYASVQQELRGRVERWMRETADPRVDPNNDAWDKYQYFGGRIVDENGNPIPKGKARLGGK
ncbi:MAG: sulfatase [Pirellulaceae bacterium]|nr:sulfatase [Pirellulaceae bacterium]